MQPVTTTKSTRNINTTITKQNDINLPNKNKTEQTAKDSDGGVYISPKQVDSVVLSDKALAASEAEKGGGGVKV